MSFVHRKIHLLLYLYIIAVLLLITSLVVLSYFTGYFNIHTDESLYFNFGRIVYEANSLKAPYILGEQASSIGGFGWYGPIYNLIYGSIFKLFGVNQVFIIIFHYILLLLCLVVINRLPLNKLKRLIFTCILLSTYIICPFVLTCYPEILHVLLSLILLVVFTKLNDSKKSFYFFLFLILLFSLMRVTFVFWIFSILFIGKSSISYILRFSICVAFVFLILVYMKLFQAPSYVIGLSEIHETKANLTNILSSIKNLVNNFKTNLYQLFNQTHSSIATFLLLLFIAALNVFQIKNNRFKSKEFGLLLIVVMTYITLLFLYNTKAYFMEKQSGFLIPMMIFIIISSKKNILLVLFISFTVFLPHSMMKSVNNFHERKNAAAKIVQYQEFKEDLSHLFDDVPQHKQDIYTILYPPDFAMEENYLSCFLPLNQNGIPIIYTVNPKYHKNITIQTKFHTFKKHKIDYILCTYPLDIPNIVLTKKTKYYYLYQYPDIAL